MLFLVAIAMHLWNLGHMAMAHDELIHAYESWKFFTGRGPFSCAGEAMPGATGTFKSDTYCYNPVYHGPTLYVTTLISYFLFGASDFTARLPQALSGIALVPMCWLLRPIIGKRTALLSAILVSLSPSLVYFARYARHDALMVLWTMFLVVGIFRWLHSGKAGDLALGAAGLALGWATHELVFILGFIVFTFFAYRWLWEYRPRWFQAATGLAIVGSGLIILARQLSTAGGETYLVLGRLLGPAMLIGGGALLALLLSFSWEQAPVFTDRVRAMWDGRGNADPSRPRTFLGRLPSALWWALGTFLVIFTLLFSVFGTYPLGFLDGWYRGLQYWWLSQHEVARGGQPWYYYLMLLPVYELLAVLVTIGGLLSLVVGLIAGWLPVGRGAAAPDGAVTEPAPTSLRARRRVTVPAAVQAVDDGYTVVGDSGGSRYATTKLSRAENLAQLFVPFTLYWGILSLIAYSWAGEKMPWLLIHTALPLTLYTAAVLSGIWGRTDWRAARARYGWAVPLLLLVTLITLLVGLFFVSGAGDTLTATQTKSKGFSALILAGLTVAGLWFIGTEIGPRLVLRLSALTLAGVLVLYSVRAISLVVYTHPDTPVEPLIYTQTSPDIPVMVDLIRQTAINQTRNDRSKDDPTGGNSMKIVLDNELAWPMQWYLRDFKSLNWTDLEKNPTVDTTAPIVLVHTPHLTQAMKDQLAEAQFVKVAGGVFNWWFPENGTVPDPRDPNKQVRAYKELTKDSAWRVMLWPLNPSNWPGLGKFMLYREIPQKIEGRDLEIYMRSDTAPLPTGAQTQPTQPVQSLQMVVATRFGTGQLNGPRGMTLDAKGNVYVADALNHRIAVFDPSRQAAAHYWQPGQWTRPVQ